MTTAKTGPTSYTAATEAGRVPAATAGAVGGLSAAAALVGNLAVLAIGRIVGADLLIRPPGAPEALHIGIFLVAATTIGLLVPGTIALAAAARWGITAWRILAWAGLAVGVISTGLPIGSTADVGTKLTLASMHVITGVVWFVAVRRGLTRTGRET